MYEKHPSRLVARGASLRTAQFSLVLALLSATMLLMASVRNSPQRVIAAAAPSARTALAQPTPCATRVYSNNFESAVGTEWSVNRTEVTPNGNRRFLGLFGNDTVSLSLANLPTHTQVTVAFDLYVIRTWDGNGTAQDYGPDVFEARAENGPTLTRTSFTAHSYLRQSYPGEYPNANNAARTGAVENNSLGYRFNNTPMDAVYRIEKTIAHTGGALKLNFSAAGLEALDNESWGLDNLVVTVDCAPAPAPCAGQVYSNDFETAVGSEWSKTQTSVTPQGNRRFLGEFNNDAVTLSLNNLSAHTQVTVSFDVYVLRSWDGSNTQWGPDLFDVRAENGAVVTRTTFSLQSPLRQAYPAEFPTAENPTATGAAETNTLGYIFDGVRKDAVFRFTKTISHSSGSLRLSFSGSGLETPSNESWGLDNVSVMLDCPQIPCTGQVYAANFETTIGSEWSTNRAEVTPAGNRRFLGQFGNETVRLSLNNLPNHTQVTVAFDVYAIRSWDGNSTQWGPDIFDVRVENGPVVTRTTFALQTPLRQAFPGEFPGGDNPTATGIVETNTLGYIFDGVRKDGVFRVSKTIPHVGADLRLLFSASGLETQSNESWGLDNVAISVNCSNSIEAETASQESLIIAPADNQSSRAPLLRIIKQDRQERRVERRRSQQR